MNNDTQDWMVIDRLHENAPVVTDLQHGEAVEMAREMSEDFGPLLRENEPTDRYAAALDTEKIRARIIADNLPVNTEISLSPRIWFDQEKNAELEDSAFSKESEYEQLRVQGIHWRDYYQGDWCPPEV